MMPKQKPTLTEIDDKLAEARFFLGHVRDEKAKQARVNKPPTEHFKFYLSALMTAVRSVTAAIEHSGRQTWRNQLNDYEKALFERSRQMRRESVHFGRIETTPEMEEVSIPFESNDPISTTIRIFGPKP
jgi:hypothetical protein